MPSLTAQTLKALHDALTPSALLSGGGGCLVCDGFPDLGWIGALRSEAESLMKSAEVQNCPNNDAEEIRGGVPSRSLLTAGGGPVQDAFYANPFVHNTLSELCATRVVPSGTRGSFNFYSRPGDYLGLHRDIDECDVALITVLHDTAGPGEGGTLVAYPDRHREPLSAIRANPRIGAEAVCAQPGQSIIIAGGLIPHCVLPTVPSQLRVISALCFQLDT